MTFSRPPVSKIPLFMVIFAVALLARVIFVLEWNETPYGSVPLLDAHVYDVWGQAISKGELFRNKAFYASPLFPYLLGLLYAIFGHSLLLAGMFNALLGAFGVASLSLIAFELFGFEASLVTGFLAAFYRPLIFYTAPVMKEPLGFLLLILFLVFSLRVLKQNRVRDYTWCGVALGLCALVRGNVLLLAPVILVLAVYRWRRKSIKGGLVFVAAFVLCILPATVHNFIASHDFVPINYADGFNFYIGNSPTANGTNEYPPEISSDPTQEELTTAWVARMALGHEPKPSEISTFWRNRAFDYIWHNPLREVVLAWRKISAFWNNGEPFDSYDIGFIAKNFDTIMSWPLPAFWMISCLASFGAVAAWRDRRNEIMAIVFLVLAYMASVMMFYVTDRYRLSVVVFLLPLSGAAIPYGQKLVKEKDWRRFSCAAALGLFFLLFAFRPPLDATDLTAFDWGTLSTIYADLGDDQKTLDAMHKAVALSPTDPGAQSLVRGSMVEQKLGNDDEAKRLLKMAAELYPRDGVVEYNYGRFQASKGDLNGALATFKKAAALSPVYVLNYYALARVYAKLGDKGHAMESVWHGLSIDPSNHLLLETLAELRRE